MKEAAHKTHWMILILLALAQFMVVLDVSIVNVALPVLQRSLQITPTNLQWIVTAYAICFGGLLLLGGRAADLYGRRRVFLIGVAAFSTASLIAGLSSNGNMLIVLRAIQGAAAAFMSPAALSIVLVTYKEGHGRNVALSVWGAVAAGGAAVGLLLGGFLTQYLNWRWNFFVNVPVGLLVMIGVLRAVHSHESEEEHNDLDLPGALSVTAGLMALVYGLVKAPTYGWTDHRTLLFLGAAFALLVFFVMNERRAKHPLMPLSIFKIRNVTGADLTQLPLAAGMFATFYFTSLYVQNVLGFSPVRTGLSFLIMPVLLAMTAANVPNVIKKIGYKKILVVAPLGVATALFLLARVPVDGSYWLHVAPSLAILAVSMGFAFVSVTVAATSGVPSRQSGLASGLLNTAQQVGGSVGLAVLTGVAASATTRFFMHNASTTPATALVHGFHAAYYVGTAFAVAASLLAVFIIKDRAPGAEVDATAMH